jgi:hypothetical protein
MWIRPPIVRIFRPLMEEAKGTDPHLANATPNRFSSSVVIIFFNSTAGALPIHYSREQSIHTTQTK